MRRLGRKWRNALPLICFFCLALTLAMGLYTYGYEPDRYSAAYTFFALPAGVNEDQSALQAARMLARDCDTLLNTETFRQEVLGRVASDGQTYVRAYGMDGTHMIRVEATGVSPDIVSALANAAGEALMTEAQSTLSAGGVREISRAMTPDMPSTPNRPLKVAAMLVGSFTILSLLGMLLGSSRKPIRFHRGKPERLSVGCYGAVQKLDGAVRRVQSKKISRECTLHHMVNRLVHENIRQVVLALRAAQEHAGYAVVTAGLAEDGDCAPVTMLMAAELADQGFDVLLIEMNAYTPTLRQLLHTDGGSDVLDCLKDEAALRTAILPTPIPKLCFMDVCHAPGFVSQVAASAAFAQFVSDAAHSFDYVFLNAPPAGTVCDAAMLGAVADMTLVMVEDGALTAEELTQSANDLRRTVRRLDGYILTDVPGRRAGTGGRYQQLLERGTLTA